MNYNDFIRPNDELIESLNKASVLNDMHSKDRSWFLMLIKLGATPHQIIVDLATKKKRSVQDLNEIFGCDIKSEKYR